MKDKVKCLECKRILGLITSHHLLICCGLTIKAYKEKYPGVETISEKIKSIRRQNCKNLTGKKKLVKCNRCGENMETAAVNRWEFICDKCREVKTYEGEKYLKDQDKVVCQICWKAFDYITWMHVKTHDITMKEYREKFPNAIITNNKILEDRGIRNTGEGNPAKREKVRKKISKSQKMSGHDYQKKYGWIFPNIEKIRDVDNNIEVQCKKCKKWFISTGSQLQERIRALNHGNDGEYMYCSDKCKGSCSLYRMNPTTIINILNKEAGSIGECSADEYYTFRQEVFRRQIEEDSFNHCEICDSTKDLNIHHEKPKKTHPHMVLDPDNGIILCKDCHEKYGHSDYCSKSKLAQLTCTKIMKK